MKQAPNTLFNKPIEIDDELEGDSDTTEEIIEDDIKEPFDPKQVKIISEQKTIDNLVQRLQFDEIELYTEFQRKGNLWKEEQQSRLIESLLLRFPIPAFFFDAEQDDKWLVVDGLQRLWTFKNFIVDKNLVLKGLEILLEYSGKGIRYTDLTRTMQRRILETQITAYIIQPSTPKKVKYNIFRRINTGGLTLTPMEIRHALNQGVAADFLRDLSEDNNFTSLIKIRNSRMEDRELILRSLAYIIFPYSDYTTPLANFLDKAMEEIGKASKDKLNQIKNNFFKALQISDELFGRDKFSRSIVSGNKIKINSALFEVWVSQLARLNNAERAKIIDNKDFLIKDYQKLIDGDVFYKSIVSSTSGKLAVTNRFIKIIALINKHKL